MSPVLRSIEYDVPGRVLVVNLEHPLSGWLRLYDGDDIVSEVVEPEPQESWVLANSPDPAGKRLIFIGSGQGDTDADVRLTFNAPDPHGGNYTVKESA